MDFVDVIAETSLRLAGAADVELDAAVDDVLAAIGTYSNAHRAYITLIIEGDVFSNTHEWVADGVTSHRETIVELSLADFPWSAAKLFAGEVWHSPDIDDLPEEAEAERRSFAEFGVVSVLQVPMRNGGRLVGALGLNHVGEPRAWTTNDIDLLRRLSDAVGLALLRREANRAVAVARDEAERTSRARAALLSSVSHEMRTPLHAILGFAELLDTPERDEAEREAIGQIVGSGRYLLGLVEQMLARADREQADQPPNE